MPIHIDVLRAHIADDLDEDITIRLATGDNMATDLVPLASILGVTLTATTDWDIHATNASAMPSADPDFGDSLMAITGVSHVFFLKGAVEYAHRALPASVDIADATPVKLNRTTVIIEYTSTDA